MKIRSTDTDPLVVELELSSPLVYLDYHVISDHAGEPIGNQLRDAILAQSGTLYWSWALAIELISICPGPTFDRINAYLASFDSRWAMLEANPSVVIEREQRWKPGDQNAAIDTDLINGVIGNWDGLTPLTLATLFDGLAGKPELTDKYKALHKKRKTEVHQIFQNARAEYRSNKASRKALNGREYVHTTGTPPTKYIYDELRRECIKTNEEFKPTDVFDFWHSVVSTAYADVVVLDQQWARRLRGPIALPSGAAEVFDGTQIGAVLEKIERWR